MTPSRVRVTNLEVYQRLGELIAETKHGVESRKVIHEKLERIEAAMNDTALNTRINADILAQTRTEMTAIKTELDDEIKPELASISTFRDSAKPLIEIMRTVRNAAIVIIALLGVGGVTVSMAFTFANDYMRGIARSWLLLDEINDNVGTR